MRVAFSPPADVLFKSDLLQQPRPRVILELLGSPNVSPHNLYSLVARNVHHSENRSAPLGGARRRPARLRHPARLGRRGRRNKAEDEGRLQNPRPPPPPPGRSPSGSRQQRVPSPRGRVFPGHPDSFKREYRSVVKAADLPDVPPRPSALSAPATSRTSAGTPRSSSASWATPGSRPP